LTLWFHVGQLAAMPALIGAYRPKPGPVRVDPQTLPGGTRFDPWCLTDPGTLSRWQADPKARNAIAALWAADPDPARTLSIHAQIQTALAAGAVTSMTGMREGSYFSCCIISTAACSMLTRPLPGTGVSADSPTVNV
jgi:hypothetical protein